MKRQLKKKNMMHRRHFLTSLAAMGAAPLVPMGSLSGTAAQTIGYNRYMYGIGVFHARTSASLSVVDLARKMAIPQSQAKMMLGEMMSKGVISPLANSARIVRAIDPIHKPKYTAREILEKAADWIDEQTDDDQVTSQETRSTAEISQSPDTQNQTS